MGELRGARERPVVITAIPMTRFHHTGLLSPGRGLMYSRWMGKEVDTGLERADAVESRGTLAASHGYYLTPAWYICAVAGQGRVQD